MEKKILREFKNEFDSMVRLKSNGDSFTVEIHRDIAAPAAEVKRVKVYEGTSLDDAKVAFQEMVSDLCEASE